MPEFQPIEYTPGPQNGPLVSEVTFAPAEGPKKSAAKKAADTTPQTAATQKES